MSGTKNASRFFDPVLHFVFRNAHFLLIWLMRLNGERTEEKYRMIFLKK